MRERSQTTPRRRGPKYSTPPIRKTSYVKEQYEQNESPYYTIDNTEDIYGTILHPSQRCYVDPWDLENYDYVRKKLASPSIPDESYYDASLSPSPTTEEPSIPTKYFYDSPSVSPTAQIYSTGRMAATMPRKSKRSHDQSDYECCPTSTTLQRRRHRRYDETTAADSGTYNGANVVNGQDKYNDYMGYLTAHLPEDNNVEHNIYTGYGGISSSSSNERNSSLDDSETLSNLMQQTCNINNHNYNNNNKNNNNNNNNYNDSSSSNSKHNSNSRSSKIANRERSVVNRTLPKLEFPAPPSFPPNYDYCNPYATMPYCSISDCYECLSHMQHQTSSSLYGYVATQPPPPPSSLYGTADGMLGNGNSIYGGSSTLMRRTARADGYYSTTSSLYNGIYAHKFGLSKKGLLQIDYSCSWNDLDRVIGRN